MNERSARGVLVHACSSTRELDWVARDGMGTCQNESQPSLGFFRIATTALRCLDHELWG